MQSLFAFSDFLAPTSKYIEDAAAKCVGMKDVLGSIYEKPTYGGGALLPILFTVSLVVLNRKIYI